MLISEKCHDFSINDVQSNVMRQCAFNLCSDFGCGISVRFSVCAAVVELGKD